MAKLLKSTVSQDVLELLRARIVSGAYPAETKLDEAALADELGVSRTPLREALAGLERDGLIRHKPYCGRVVAAVEDAVVVETFPIIGALEALAVRQTPKFSPALLDRLDGLNERIGRPNATGRKRHAVDREWHAALVSACGNDRLIELAARQHALASRYDGGPKRGMAAIERSIEEHARVVAELRGGDADAAARSIEEHWNNGIGTVLEWRKHSQRGSAGSGPRS